MKTLLAAAVSLSLIAGAVTPAYADNRDHDRHESRSGQRHDGHYDRNDRHDSRRDDRHDGRDNGRRYDNHAHRDSGRDSGRDHRSGYIEGRRDQHRYQVARYIVPRGYQVRTWHRGDRLPPSYYSSRYIINDYHAYRLYAPGRGQHWVRVNNDVLLTAVATGAVVAVVGGLFY